MKFKIGDWVEIVKSGHISKITEIDDMSFDYALYNLNNNTKWYSQHDLIKCAFIHKIYNLGWITLSFFKLKNKFTIRFEISKGWE